MQCCRSAFVSMRILIQLFADLDHDPGSQTNDSKSQKVKFLHKNDVYGRYYVKKHTCEGTKTFFRGKEPGLLVIFVNFHGFWSWSGWCFPYSDPNLDPGQSDKCGYKSTTKVQCSLKYFNVLLKSFFNKCSKCSNHIPVPYVITDTLCDSLPAPSRQKIICTNVTEV